ncbi:DNA-binding response regulator [Clostridia bacterium]|nr:DNA-binding response regulator [Clostridia bacterium]
MSEEFLEQLEEGEELNLEKVLIVEDDENIAEILRMYLAREGYDVAVAENGREGLRLFEELQPILVMLDIMLPVTDGWEVLKIIRQTSKVPVIMLTAKGQTVDKVQGLEMGADDYITKPFEMKEVMARVHAVMRRYDQNQPPKRLEFDNLVIDMAAYVLIADGKSIEVPPKELELLAHLAASPNRVYTRNQLLDEVWGFDYFGDSRTVDVHIKRLREKLDGASDRWALKTVWGIGYKFALDEQAEA